MALAGLLAARPGELMALPAFPGAEGAGALTTGGRGGFVAEVTNLNDSGPGSLRAALALTGTRTIVFRVSGTIYLQTPINLNRGDVTIAGQTAPGDGICIAHRNFKVNANNVIIRHIRFRLGDTRGVEEDALTIGPNRSRIIIDHCSVSWSVDEGFSTYDNDQVTVQWTLISESLNNSVHSKGQHGYGGIWGGKGVSFHHNLFAHHKSRTPRFNGARYDARPEYVDFRNNVLYNWGDNNIYGGELSAGINIVNNYFKFGPGTGSSKRSRICEPYDAVGKWYLSGNVVTNSLLVTQNNWLGVQGTHGTNPAIRSETEFDIAAHRIQSAQEAYDQVLQYVGAVLPRRDAVDTRILQEVRAGTTTYGGTYGASSGIIDSQETVGGWPVLNSTTPPPDRDFDGIPDDWEVANGLNPDNAADGRAVGDPRGYTNLEIYLNALAAWGVPPEYRDPDGLTVTLEGDKLRASWSPIYHGMVVLESAEDPGASEWVSHGSGNGHEVVLDAPAPGTERRFFRLVRKE